MKRLLVLAFCISFGTICSADEPVGFKGTILFSDGQEIAFEYIGDLDGPKEYKIEGKIGERDVSYSPSSLRSIHLITPSGGRTRHAEVVGHTGKKIIIQSPVFYFNSHYMTGSWRLSKFPNFVYLDSLTETRKIHSSINFNKICVVTINSQSGQYKWNPTTKQYYPNYYLYDPYDGTSLQWVSQPPQVQSEQAQQTRTRQSAMPSAQARKARTRQSAIPSAQSRQSQLQTTRDTVSERKIALARLELQKAEDELWKAYEEAKVAYDDLKSTKGTEIFQSMEAAVTEPLRITGEALRDEVALIAIERELGQAVSIEAGKQAATFLGFLGAAKTYLDIGEWLAKDSVLISKNVKSNWLTLTKVWPARRRYDEAKRKLEALESLQN